MLASGPWDLAISGRLERVELDAPALRGNKLGDPDRRPALVWLPPIYDLERSRRFPVVYVLQPFGGFVTTWLNRRAFEQPVIELIDRALAARRDAPIVVYVDAWTRLGGSQFLDSPAVGNYRTYLCEDVVGGIDARYRTINAANGRGLYGHSSGGYGALVTGMTRPDLFGALAATAPDAAFELTLVPEFPSAYRALRDQYGSLDHFLEMLSNGDPDDSIDHALLNVYACAACYSPLPDGSVALPFSTVSGALDEEVFTRWLACDPVRLIEPHAEALRSRRGIHLDAGRSDEYHLDVAAEILAAELTRVGASSDLTLFAGGHRNVASRYPLALARLADDLEAASI